MALLALKVADPCPSAMELWKVLFRFFCILLLKG